jgi:hypothetical protein
MDETRVAEVEISLCAMGFRVLEETVGVVPFEPGEAAAAVKLPPFGILVVARATDVLTTRAVVEDMIGVPPAVLTTPNVELCVVVLVVLVGLVGGCAAVSVASLPVSVVNDLGTAVHRWPSIVVIKNPAGRFGLVDMMKNGKRHQSLQRNVGVV